VTVRVRKFALATAGAVIAACATVPDDQGTLAELQQLETDVADVYLEDGLERAAQSYRRYLEETDRNDRTPEAMRRLADLQIEQAYGVLGNDEITELAAPQAGSLPLTNSSPSVAAEPATPDESDLEFEQRATQRETLLTQEPDVGDELLIGVGEQVPAGPREAIETYKQILELYPHYERNDRVLYQMSRAYDEIGQPDAAMKVMNRFVTEYPYSRYVDEVQFRRGEYYFVRKQWLDAEQAYAAVTGLGSTTSYYELALYKLGWTLYKQYLYEEALHRFMGMLDYQLTTGYDFDTLDEEDEEHRINDTFRVISLSFSNLGGPEVVDDYYSRFGHRSYADKVYRNLGEFYFEKLRYDDATSVYRSFVDLNPYHRASPEFSMRIVEIFDEAGFPLRVVESKKDFASRYALTSEYWNYHDVEEATEVVGFLKTNLADLAGHYHALYQQDVLPGKRPAHFNEATRWYQQFIASFPADTDTPQVNYRLADLLLENEDFLAAAREYEKTGYEYAAHEQAAAAGYAAVYAYRQELSRATGARQREIKRETVTSSLKFADTFPDHEEASIVLGAAADDLYVMKDFELAIESARKLIDRYPLADDALLRSAWAVVAHSSIDIAQYVDAENAYASLLALTPADDETRDAVIDGLAAAIYKQAEQANLVEDYRTAAGHFLRIKTVTPTSGIRSAAEYDAAAALMKLEDWTLAAGVLEEFRSSHPDHELNMEATKQLAHVYRVDGQIARSAAEHERISAEADDPVLAREALLTAGELYDEAGDENEALRVYENYVFEYPRPLDFAIETRTRMAEIFESQLDYSRYHEELEAIVALDRDSDADRTDRSRVLASRAALVLAERAFERFDRVKLNQPFEQSLAAKQTQMDITLKAMEDLVGYEIANVTAAATYYIAQTYFEFSQSLLESERPAGLSEAEKIDYELVIEEEAYPFEEQAIAVHEENHELLVSGIYNPWVQKSLDRLAVMMPGRYAKTETSEGFLGSIDVYAYRMPIAPPPLADDVIDGEAAPDATAVIAGGTEGNAN
jgi:tetratricopeptide (TPR) repeat protein